MLFAWLMLAELFIPAKDAPPPVAAFVTPPRSGSIALEYRTLTLVGTAPTNGDDDGYADAGETNDLTLTLVNNTGLNLTNVVATIATNDATVECLNPYQVTIPTVDAGATFTTPAFRIKIADSVSRSDVGQTLEANLTISMRADQFDVLARPMRITLPLDLDLTTSGGLGTWFEDFETGGLGKFVQQTLDAGKSSLVAGDGMRCQYDDPGYGNVNPDCFPGFSTDPPAGVNDWHLHDAGAANGGVGRAYAGTKSMHWGVHLGSTPKRDTTRLKQVDAVKSSVINVPSADLHPELSFAQQVSLVDHRGIDNFTPGETADRAVVEVNILDAQGLDGPLWKKIYPYVNAYDEQGTDDVTHCTFDPTDDGNDEDDYFDPSDPYRRYGPSSTCKPEFAYACQGDTDYHIDPLIPPKGCNAEGPAYKTDGVGSWVVPVFNLQEFAGRRIKVRFLASSIELGSTQTWDPFFGRDDTYADDGWYIDAVKVSPVANLAPALTPDTKTITPIPCAACTTISASMTATPSATPEPFVPVVLDASASTIDVCKNGPPQYTFWVDGNGNGVAGDAGDTLLRAASPDPRLTIAPAMSGMLAAVVSCVNEPQCDAADGSNTAEAFVTVNCPPGIDRTAFGQTIVLDKDPQPTTIQISWPVAKQVDVVLGCLVGSCNGSPTLRGSGSFAGTLYCDYDGSGLAPISSITDSSPLDPGGGLYYLVRGKTPACTQTQTGYSTNEPTERPGRDAEIAADPNTCP